VDAGDLPNDDDAVRAAVEAELALLDPAVRTSPRAAELLDEQFTEVGASGRIWDRAALLAAMAGELSLAGTPVEVGAVDGVRLAPTVVLVRYTTVRDGRRVHRSSVWRLTGGRWRLVHHQGTPAGT
jgi:hypothetical protein